ncbi:MAG: kelch repeat-containing protein, partial [Bacteroidota bacterium]
MNNRFLPLRIICGSLLLLVFLHTSGRSQTTVPGWRSHTPLPLALTGHRTLLLPTGDVLIAGGLTSDGTVTRTSYLYSPATGTFRPTLNQLITARAGHALIAVTVAGSARVFAIGGFGGTAGNYRGEATVEMLEYDAAVGNWRWRGIGSLGLARGEPRAAWDGGGSIIVTGGYAQNGGAIRGGTRTTAADKIDIIGLNVRPIDPMSAARAEHVAARIIGDNGIPQVLVAGGEDLPATTSTQLLRGTAWDPIANPPLAYHSAGIGVGDPAGVARVFGGFDGGGAPTGACEWYDVKRGWRAAPRMLAPRARFNATTVAGTADTVAAYLAAAGIGAGGALSGTEVFQLPGASFPNGAWISFPSLVVAGSERDIAITGNNLPLVSGGSDRSDAAIAATEIFQPFRASDRSFGDEEVGRRSDSTPVSIENEWLLPVRAEHFRIVGSAEFSFRGDTADFTLPAGGRRTIRLYFRPALAGPRDGLLLFDIGSITDTVRLSGRGIASRIGIINSPLDFGTGLLGAHRTECRYLLRNSGTDTSVIDSVVLAPPGSFRLISPIGRVAVAPGDS